MDGKQALGLTEVLLDRTRPGSASAPSCKQPLLTPWQSLSSTRATPRPTRSASIDQTYGCKPLQGHSGEGTSPRLGPRPESRVSPATRAVRRNGGLRCANPTYGWRCLTASPHLPSRLVFPPCPPKWVAKSNCSFPYNSAIYGIWDFLVQGARGTDRSGRPCSCLAAQERETQRPVSPADGHPDCPRRGGTPHEARNLDV